MTLFTRFGLRIHRTCRQIHVSTLQHTAPVDKSMFRHSLGPSQTPHLPTKPFFDSIKHVCLCTLHRRFLGNTRGNQRAIRINTCVYAHFIDDYTEIGAVLMRKHRTYRQIHAEGMRKHRTCRQIHYSMKTSFVWIKSEGISRPQP